MAPKFSKNAKSNKTIEELNDYCLYDIIEKLSLKEKFRFRLNNRLKGLVDKSLESTKGLKIGRNVGNCCDLRHSALSLATSGQQNNELFELNDKNKNTLRMFFKFCPNIRCIEMSAEIDLKVIAWIRKQCKYLECLQINNSVLNTRLTSRQWIQIGEILSDNLIHLSINSVTNPEKLSEFSLIYLVQNFTKLEEFSFDVNDMPIDKIFTYFGPNLKTLKLNKCYKYRVSQNTFNILRQNAVNLETLEVEGYDIETLDLICNTFHELKSLNMFFFSSWLNMDSLSQLSQMPHLERLKIEFYQNRGVINYLAKTVFPNLHSLNLTGISFTPKLFEEFTHYFPNIRQLVLQNCSLLCDDRSDDFRDRQDCNDCKERVWKYLSKLTHLKQLSVNLLPRKDTGFSKSYVWTLNERSFPAIEELDFQWLPYDSKSFTENLLNPLNAFAKKHPKRQFKLRVNQDFFEFVSKKRQINGVKYNVMSSNIERNVKIINYYT